MADTNVTQRRLMELKAEVYDLSAAQAEIAQRINARNVEIQRLTQLQSEKQSAEEVQEQCGEQH